MKSLELVSILATIRYYENVFADDELLIITEKFVGLGCECTHGSSLNWMK